MNIRTRTRNVLLAAVVTGAVSAVLAMPGTAQAEFGLGTPQVNPDTFRDEVVERMGGLGAFGWQLAIAQDGKFALADKGGTAISAADNGGVPVPMQPTMRMELASVTKTITAVATMKLLRLNDLTVNSPVWPHLPEAWNVSKFKGVTFRHLLTHTSGINQAILAMPPATRPKDNSWDSMKVVVENGTVIDSQRQYKNANYAILRIVNAKLWNLSGGKKGKVGEGNHSSFALDFMRKSIFEPAGLDGIGCIQPGTTTGVRSYRLGATQASKGRVWGTGDAECAGHRGIAMSAIQLVQFLAHLRHGSIIHPADLATMDQLRAGWWEDSNLGDGGQFGLQDGLPDNQLSAGAFWHDGALFGGANDPALWTCAITFSDGTEAALLIPSGITPGSTACGVLLSAYREAQ